MNTAKVKLLVGGVLIAAGLITLGVFAASANAQYAVGVKEWAEKKARFEGKGLRLAGRTLPGTWRTDGRRHEFVIVEPGPATPEATPDVRVKVVFEGTMPDTFKEDMDVILAGKMNGDTFVASEVMTQCASKYQGVDGNYIETARKQASGTS